MLVTSDVPSNMVTVGRPFRDEDNRLPYHLAILTIIALSVECWMLLLHGISFAMTMAGFTN